MFAATDLHVDYEENMEWCRSIDHDVYRWATGLRAACGLLLPTALLAPPHPDGQLSSHSCLYRNNL